MRQAVQQPGIAAVASKRRTGFRWVVLALVFLVYMVAGADRANLGVVIPFLKENYKLSNTDIGAMTSLFFLGYAGLQIPFGILFARYGVRKLFTLSIVLTSLATLLMGFVGSAFQMKAVRLLLGAAEGPLNIGIVTTINRWFPPQEKGTATGVFMASIKFAPAMVPPVCALIVVNFGWEYVFYLFAIPGFVTAALWFWLVKDDPADSPFNSAIEVDYINSRERPVRSASTRSATQRRPASPLMDRLIRARMIVPLDTNAKVLRSASLWGCALGYFFMVGITYTIMTWVPTYLVAVKHFAVIKMGFVAAAPWVGAMAGNIIGGWLSDKVFAGRRKPVMLITTAATVVMMYLLIYSPNEPVLLAAELFGAGVLLNLGYSTFLAYPMGLVSKERYPFAASIVNTAGSLGGAFAPFVVGLLLDAFSWDSVFMFLSTMSLVTFFILLSTIEPLEAASAVR
jgi:ACS family glucarate transporter-like MFS transporter